MTSPLMSTSTKKRRGRSWCISNVLTFLTVTFVSVLLNKSCCNGDSSSSEEFSLVISHWNNIHGHFYPGGSNPQKSDLSTSGLAGLVSGLNQNLNQFIPSKYQDSNHIRLSSGDFLGPENGWLSFVTFSENKTIAPKFFELLKKLHDTHLNPTAVSATWSDLRFGWEIESKTFGGTPLSRHKFVAEPPNLILSNVDHPIPFSPKNWDPWRIHPIRDRNGKTGLIAILGFLPPKPSNPLNLVLEMTHLSVRDVIESLQNALESAESGADSKIHFFIAVGDCDRKLCEDILDVLPQIKVLISGGSLGFEEGGHFLHKNGGIIASAGIGGSSMGRIQLRMDSKTGNFGTIKATLMSNTFTPDPETQVTLTSFLDLIHQSSTANRVIGRVEYPLNCKSGTIENIAKNYETPSDDVFCPLGNIVADSLARCVDRTEIFSSHKNPDISGHTHSKQPIIALWHSSGLTNQKISISAFQDIRELDVHAWMPFLDTAKLFRIKGHQLSQFFNLHHDNLHVSEHLRVHFEGQVVQGIYHSLGNGGQRVRDEDELLVLIPTFLNFTCGNTSHCHSYQTKPIDVRCVTSLLQDTRSLTWGGHVRISISLPKKDDINNSQEGQEHNWLAVSFLAIATVVTVLLFLGLLILVIRKFRRRGHLRRWRNRATTTSLDQERNTSLNRGRGNQTSSIWPLMDIQRERRRRGRGEREELELEPFILSR